MDLKKGLSIFCLFLSLVLSCESAKKQNVEEKKKEISFHKITNQTLEEFNSNNLDQLDFSSPCESYYPNYSSINSMIHQLDNLENCQFKFDGNIDALIQKIHENSDFLLKSNSNFTNAFNHSNGNEDNQNFEVALKSVLTDYSKSSLNDKEEDFCLMNSLSIVFEKKAVPSEVSIKNPIVKYSPSENKYMILAYYAPKYNLIVLNIDSIKETKGQSTLLWEEIAYYLRHEINHVRQCVCSCRKGKLDFSRISMDSELPSFFIESSAESEVYNVWDTPLINQYKNDTNLLTYQLYRKYEALLFVLTLGREKISLNDYYSAIFNSDFDALFAFFGATTLEEKKEISFILSSMDATLLTSDVCFKYYQSNRPLSYNDAKQAVGFDYKLLIFRNFLKQMMQYTKTHDDFSIESNIYLYDLIKQMMISDSFYYDKYNHEKVVYDKEFFMKMKRMEEYYFQYLENHYQKSIEPIWNEIKTSNDNKLIEMEIYRSLVLCDEDFSFPLTFSEPVKDLYERFPTLSSIVFASTYHMDYNDAILKDHQPKMHLNLS